MDNNNVTLLPNRTIGEKLDRNLRNNPELKRKQEDYTKLVERILGHKETCRQLSIDSFAAYTQGSHFPTSDEYSLTLFLLNDVFGNYKRKASIIIPNKVGVIEKEFWKQPHNQNCFFRIPISVVTPNRAATYEFDQQNFCQEELKEIASKLEGIYSTLCWVTDPHYKLQKGEDQLRWLDLLVGIGLKLSPTFAGFERLEGKVTGYYDECEGIQMPHGLLLATPDPSEESDGFTYLRPTNIRSSEISVGTRILAMYNHQRDAALYEEKAFDGTILHIQ